MVSVVYGSNGVMGCRKSVAPKVGSERNMSENQSRFPIPKWIRILAPPLIIAMVLLCAACAGEDGDYQQGASARQPEQSAVESKAEVEQQQEAAYQHDQQQAEESAAVAPRRRESRTEAAAQEEVEEEAVEEEAKEAVEEEAEEEEAEEDVADSSLEDSSGDGERQGASLSAGEVNDNERWDEYLQYRSEYSWLNVHDVDISERYVITVSDSGGQGAPNARVRVSAGQVSLFEGRTYANGQTLFFPRAFAGSEGVESFTLHVERDGQSQQLEVSRGEPWDWNVTLDVDQPEAGGIPLDILFLLDATGSMSDEIDQIEDTLLSIASRISHLPSEPDLRFGMVPYRDRGDAFVTRVYDFEADAGRFLDTIRGVVADEGGDNPESLNEAMHVAVHEPQWRLGRGIRLMFLIADAPPHLDYANDYSYADEMIEAHRRAIKTFSIASSGLDPQGEYVFRQIAQHTMGRFIFIVRGRGGTTPHNVGQYTVERLDDLVVSLVEDELAHLSR